MVDFDRRRPISSGISEGGRKKKREKKRRTWRFLRLIRRSRAISRPGRINISPYGEKEQGDESPRSPFSPQGDEASPRLVSLTDRTGTGEAPSFLPFILLPHLLSPLINHRWSKSTIDGRSRRYRPVEGSRHIDILLDRYVPLIPSGTYRNGEP
ncbi:hypothetical protein BHM03_00037410 [Ensete ventricosum]|nr:hypothetical protein BHM03_00037410 [Ensete ventricosum]